MFLHYITCDYMLKFTGDTFLFVSNCMKLRFQVRDYRYNFVVV